MDPSRTDLEKTEQTRAGAPPWAVLLYLLGFVGLTAALLPLAADPTTYDELLYMGVAWDPYESPHILNRYFHIYLLRACMALTQDPFLGARLLWAASLAGAAVALVAASAPFRPGTRVFVLLLTLVLMLSQRALTWSAGLAYVDHTAMLLATVGFALAAGAVLRGREIPHRVALVLGTMFYLGLKTKEPMLFAGLLPLLFFVRPDGSDIRVGLAAWSRLLVYAAGIVLGVLLICGLDAWQLGDAWFSVRPDNWRAMAEFNSGTGRSGAYSWLTWMLDPLNYAAFVLYTGTLLLWAATSRHLREVLLYSMPLGLLGLLAALTLASNTPVSYRYTWPLLPLMCFAAAAMTARLLARPATGRLTPGALAGGYAIALAGLLMQFGLIDTDGMRQIRYPDPQFLRDTVQPLTVFVACVAGAAGAALTFGLRAPLLLLALASLVVGAVPPGARVVDSLGRRDLAKLGAERWRDLRDLLAAADVRPGTRLLLDPLLYEKQLSDRGEKIYKPLIGMYAGQRLSWDDIVTADPAEWSAGDLAAFDLLLLTPGQAERLRETGRVAGEPLPGPAGDVVLIRPSGGASGGT